MCIARIVYNDMRICVLRGQSTMICVYVYFRESFQLFAYNCIIGKPRITHLARRTLLSPFSTDSSGRTLISAYDALLNKYFTIYNNPGTQDKLEIGVKTLFGQQRDRQREQRWVYKFHFYLKLLKKQHITEPIESIYFQ